MQEVGDLSNDLITDKTFFITYAGDVHTYHKTNTDPENGLQILVYDRDSSTGLTPLNLEEVKYTLTEYSEQYNMLLKDFLKFLATDLSTYPLLQKYITQIWNGDYEEAFQTQFEDVSLPEKFTDYMQDLIERKAFDECALRYFNAVFCEQEVTYCKYNKEWLLSEF